MDLGLFDANHVVLAVVERDALLVVVVKEAVQTAAVDKDVLGVGRAETPGAGALVRVAGAAGLEVRVRVLGVDVKGGERVGVALEVGRLGLDQRHVHVLGVGELVVVHDVVLGRGAPEPGALGALDEDTAAVVDVDLRVVGEVELVVGDPVPGVLEVDGGFGGDMEKHESTNALGVGGSGNFGSLLASVRLELGTSRATNAEVNVKETSRAGSLTRNVELHEDSTGLRTSSLEHEILHLNVADIALLTDLPDRLGVGLVLESLVASSHDEGPDLADNLDVLGNLDSVGDEVSAVIEVDNLVLLDGIKDGLDGSGIVSLTITHGALGLDGDKLGGIDVGVLGLALGDDVARLVKKTGGLGGGGLRVLNGLAITTSVGATLDPGVNLGVAGEDSGFGSRVLDGNGDVGGHVNIVNDESAVGASLTSGVDSVDTDGGVGDLAVEDESRADGLSRTAIGNVNTDATVLDGDTVDGPEPVPVHEDGSVAVLELHVAGGELLGSKEGTILSTDKGEISHETTGAVVHEDTHLSILLARVLNHVELDVLEGSSLGDLPVDTGTNSLGHTSQINLEVANLTEEVVLVGEPIDTVVVGVRVNDGHALKVGSSLESRERGDITDELSVVVGNNGLGDDIGTRGEVDKSRSDGGGIATLSTSVALADGGIDGSGIVGASIALCTVVLDVAEDLVASGITESYSSLTLNGAEPPRSARGGRRSTTISSFDRGEDGGDNRGRGEDGHREEAQGQEGRGQDGRETHCVEPAIRCPPGNRE